MMRPKMIVTAQAPNVPTANKRLSLASVCSALKDTFTNRRVKRSETNKPANFARKAQLEAKLLALPMNSAVPDNRFTTNPATASRQYGKMADLGMALTKPITRRDNMTEIPTKTPMPKA